MSTAGIEFRRRAVRPVQCFRDGWRLIRDDYWKFLGITFVGLLLGSLAPLYILVGPMMCGIFLCMRRQADGRRVAFDMLFRGFDHFVQSLIATLVIVIPIVVILVPLSIGFMVFASQTMVPQPGPGGRAGPPDPGAVWAFLAMLGGFYVALFVLSVFIYSLFLFTYPLIADRGLSGMEAVGVSSRAALANFGGVVGLVLLNNLLSILGLFACYVGAVFLIPLSLASVFVAYRQVFPDDEYEDSDDGTLPPAADLPDRPGDVTDGR